MPSKLDDAEKREIKERVISIIHHQTGGPQPETINLAHIKLLANRADYDSSQIEWAVNVLADQGSITYREEGYQLGSATIDRGDISF